jgi:hypothetical protein
MMSLKDCGLLLNFISGQLNATNNEFYEFYEFYAFATGYFVRKSV